MRPWLLWGYTWTPYWPYDLVIWKLKLPYKTTVTMLSLHAVAHEVLVHPPLVQYPGCHDDLIRAHRYEGELWWRPHMWYAPRLPARCIPLVLVAGDDGAHGLRGLAVTPHGGHAVLSQTACNQNRRKIRLLNLASISMGWCKKDVTPLLTHWSYVFLALTHQYEDCLSNYRWFTGLLPNMSGDYDDLH